MISRFRPLTTLRPFHRYNLQYTSLHSIHFSTSSELMTSTKDLSVNVWQPQDAVPPHVKELLTPGGKPINYILAFIQILRLLKTQKRTGWIACGVPAFDTESIADHMYRMSIISMLVPHVNTDKCVKIAVVHDIAETLVGDITPFCGISKEEKHRRELATIEFLSEIIKPYNEPFSYEIKELWLDYEEIRTPEARYVKDIDKYEMIETAWEYEQQFGLTYDLSQFYTARAAIKTPEISELCDEVIRRRNELVKKLEKEN
ncbi:uncharacterized protein SPAPADRAFT_149136 [Spathaspora passalidarum NRRL Y-27907]|uniref:5'-deoxynucleotidase n=1 Tax=Spathaspora passalidarum (strain NRRL Y-27907 / 11-Y1) TaxID=619300 RepID=G3AI47_SPAPN|nr:uncharacterized protein SPAPADRAFT_149136 [Spathaspora passalidarum NRRL Y-27907]EGW34360.1 hypothetical protein SPAPADRAFT_149136 [Spathaspora passalidarum NRRL Y-27907]